MDLEKLRESANAVDPKLLSLFMSKYHTVSRGQFRKDSLSAAIRRGNEPPKTVPYF